MYDYLWNFIKMGSRNVWDNTKNCREMQFSWLHTASIWSGRSASKPSNPRLKTQISIRIEPIHETSISYPNKTNASTAACLREPIRASLQLKIGSLDDRSAQELSLVDRHKITLVLGWLIRNNNVWSTDIWILKQSQWLSKRRGSQSRDPDSGAIRLEWI